MAEHAAAAGACVHVIDDDAAMRDSLTFLFSTYGMQVRAHESAEDFLATIDRHALGCVVSDVRMPGMSGIELLARLKSLGMTLPVVVITGHGDVPLAVEAMKGGAVDFIEKPFDDRDLLAAVKSALAQYRPAPSRDGAKSAIAGRLEALSGRERDVLEGLLAGKPNKAIALDLGISPRTVEVYRANLMTKMGARSLADLVRMALSAGE